MSYCINYDFNDKYVGDDYENLTYSVLNRDNDEADYAPSTPILNYIHILQCEPMEEQIRLVDEYAGRCVLLNIDELEVSGIALIACGMDFSDNIELAYYLTDGTSPVKSEQIMSLSKKAEALLMFCRKHKRVWFSSVKEFLNNYDENKKEK